MLSIITILFNMVPASIAMNAAEIQEKMGLRELHDRKWFIHPTCATTGDGLYEGLEWLRTQHLGEEHCQADTLDRKRLSSI